MEIAQDMLMTYNNDPDMLKKILTGDKLWGMAMKLNPKPNHPNESVQKSQDREKQVKFCQM